MRFLALGFAAVLLFGACNLRAEDTTYSYSIGSGYSSNIFQDPTVLGGAFHEFQLELRGSLALESSTLTYSAGHARKLVPQYDFAKEHRTALELGYQVDVGKAVQLAVKAGVARQDKGDLLTLLPGLAIGYRETDYIFETGAGAVAEMFGGKTSITATYGTINRGDARFVLREISPIRVEAEADRLELAANHIRPMLGGEAGAYLQYRRSLVSKSDQAAYGRFPAETLRGSLAFGRQLGENVKLLADAGIVALSSDDVDLTKPYFRTELEWRAPKGLTFGAGFMQDMTVSDIDDAVAEYVRTLKLSVTKAITEKSELGLGYEQAWSDWSFYDYATRTGKWSATAKFALADKVALTVELAHLRRRETSELGDFTANSLAARLGGSF
ncbi:MAG: hypothetical protein QHC90_18100 [Shinella sp.]|nr:hypothetical protein [Shinella sp.]